MTSLKGFWKIAMSYRAVVLAATLAGGMLSLAVGFDEMFEHGMRSSRDALRGHDASGEIVIVEIDARSLAEIDRWPWPREIHGELVDRLGAAKVEMIAFDVDLSSQSNAAADAAFARSLADSESLVILPAFRQYASSNSEHYIDSEPIEELRRSAFLASVNVQPDENGVVRRSLLGVYTGGVPRPSLAAMLSGTHGTAATDFPIDFAIEPDSIPRLSYADILAGRVPLETLRGRKIVIGATAIEMGDRYVVPRHGVIPGVVMQTLAAETLASGVPTEYGPWPALLVALAGIVVMLFPGKTGWRATAGGGAAILVLLLPLIAESRLQTTFQIVPALAMLASAGVAGLTILALRKYRRAALIDSASGLPNRLALQKEARGTGSVRVIATRIEGFANIAAQLDTTDIREFFVEIDRRMRAFDGETPIYRIDEAVLAWRADSMAEDEIADHLDGLRTMFRMPVCLPGQTIDIGLNFGVAEGSGREAAELVSGAALAAQRAAKAGHVWERHLPGEQAEEKWHLSLLAELDEAMETGALFVAYQPKLDIESREIVSAEALVRWQHPTRGLVPPDHFIPLVEKRGRIGDLTLFVIDRALEAMHAWSSSGLRIGVAVNVSATLLDSQTFLDALARRIRTLQLDPELLTIEITETAAFENPGLAIEGMTALRALGVRLSVDDYGTGQSTLSYLKRLPVQEIKIDKSFVQTIPDNPSDMILVRSTIDLAHELGLTVVAEGIEDEACLAQLAKFGCDYGQGYLIGRPMAPDDLIARLRRAPSLAA